MSSLRNYLGVKTTTEEGTVKIEDESGLVENLGRANSHIECYSIDPADKKIYVVEQYAIRPENYSSVSANDISEGLDIKIDNLKNKGLLNFVTVTEKIDGHLDYKNQDILICRYDGEIMAEMKNRSDILGGVNNISNVFYKDESRMQNVDFEKIFNHSFKDSDKRESWAGRVANENKDLFPSDNNKSPKELFLERYAEAAVEQTCEKITEKMNFGYKDDIQIQNDVHKIESIVKSIDIIEKASIKAFVDHKVPISEGSLDLVSSQKEFKEILTEIGNYRDDFLDKVKSCVQDIDSPAKRICNIVENYKERDSLSSKNVIAELDGLNAGLDNNKIKEKLDIVLRDYNDSVSKEKRVHIGEDGRLFNAYGIAYQEKGDKKDTKEERINDVQDRFFTKENVMNDVAPHPPQQIAGFDEHGDVKWTANLGDREEYLKEYGNIGFSELETYLTTSEDGEPIDRAISTGIESFTSFIVDITKNEDEESAGIIKCIIDAYKNYDFKEFKDSTKHISTDSEEQIQFFKTILLNEDVKDKLGLGDKTDEEIEKEIIAFFDIKTVQDTDTGVNKNEDKTAFNTDDADDKSRFEVLKEKTQTLELKYKNTRLGSNTFYSYNKLLLTIEGRKNGMMVSELSTAKLKEGVPDRPISTADVVFGVINFTQTNILETLATSVIVSVLDWADAQFEKIEDKKNDVENENATNDEPDANNEDTADDEPDVDNEDTADDEPDVDNEDTADDEPDVDNEDTADDEPDVDNESTADNEPDVDNEDTADDEPDVDNESTADNDTYVDYEDVDIEQQESEVEPPDAEKSNNEKVDVAVAAEEINADNEDNTADDSEEKITGETKIADDETEEPMEKDKLKSNNVDNEQQKSEDESDKQQKNEGNITTTDRFFVDNANEIVSDILVDAFKDEAMGADDILSMLSTDYAELYNECEIENAWSEAVVKYVNGNEGSIEQKTDVLETYLNTICRNEDGSIDILSIPGLIDDIESKLIAGVADNVGITADIWDKILDDIADRIENSEAYCLLTDDDRMVFSDGIRDVEIGPGDYDDIDIIANSILDWLNGAVDKIVTSIEDIARDIIKDTIEFFTDKSESDIAIVAETESKENINSDAIDTDNDNANVADDVILENTVTELSDINQDIQDNMKDVMSEITDVEADMPADAEQDNIQDSVEVDNNNDIEIFNDTDDMDMDWVE